MDTKMQYTLNLLFEESKSLYTIGEKQVPIYFLKKEFEEHILSKVFPTEHHRRCFENKTLDEQISLVKVHRFYQRRECNLYFSNLFGISIATPAEMAELYGKNRLSIFDGLPSTELRGVLMCGELFLGFLVGGGSELLWVGSTVNYVECDIDCTGDNNGAGYSGGGDVYEYTFSLVYIVYGSDELPKNTLFYHPSHQDVEVFDASEYEVIGECAFGGCKKLKKVILSDKTRIIRENAFKGCYSLAEITLPEGLEEIGAGAFLGTALKKVAFPENLKKLGKGSFENCDCLEEVICSESMEEIPPRLFVGCTSLKNVILNKNLKKVGTFAFGYCKALEKIDLSGGVEEIESYVFQRCSSLKTVVFSSALQKIGDGAFLECDALECVELPEGLQTLGDGVFRGCSALKELILPKKFKDNP